MSLLKLCLVVAGIPQLMDLAHIMPNLIRHREPPTIFSVFSAGIAFLDDQGHDNNDKFRHPLLYIDNLTIDIEDSPPTPDA